MFKNKAFETGPTVYSPYLRKLEGLRNGPDKNDSNNGNEHVGIQSVCEKVITFLLSVLTSDWLKQQTVNKTS